MVHRLCVCHLQLSQDNAAAAERIAQLHRQHAAAAQELQDMQGLPQAAANHREHGEGPAAAQDVQLQSLRDELEGLRDQLYRWKKTPRFSDAGRLCNCPSTCGVSNVHPCLRRHSPAQAPVKRRLHEWQQLAEGADSAAAEDDAMCALSEEACTLRCMIVVAACCLRRH